MVEGESTSTIDAMPSSGMSSPPETIQYQAQEELQSQPSSRHHRWTAYLLSLNPYRWNPLMGWPLLITYAVLTFAQSLPVTAVGLYMANTLHLGPDDTPDYYAATFIPWTIRPVYAFVSDQIPIFSYRRRPYFFLCALFGCCSQVCMSLFGTSRHNFFILGVTTQVFLAFCEVICDSLAVEWANELADKISEYKHQQKASDNQSSAFPSPLTNSSSPTLPTTPTRIEVQPNTDYDWRQPLLTNEVLTSSAPASPQPSLLSSSSSSSATTTTTASSLFHTSHPNYSSLDHPPPSPSQSPSSLSSPSSSSSSSSSLPSSATLSPDPRDAYIDDLLNATLTDLILTSDPSRLSPLITKSRIQSECMTIRSTGSVLASATSIVMMLYWEPRTVLFWGSAAFLIGIIALLFYRQERKVKPGSFWLADVSESEEAIKPIVIADITIVPSVGKLVEKNSTPNLNGESENMSQSHLRVTIQDGAQSSDIADDRPSSSSSASSLPIVSSSMKFVSHPSSGSVECDDAIVSDSEEGITLSSDSRSFCGLTLTQWIFLYRKLLALINALKLLSRPLLFIFLINLVPSSEDAYSNYLYSHYDNFMDWEYGLFDFIGLGGSLIGCIFYQQVLAPSIQSLKMIFVVTTLSSALIGCSTILLATESNSKIGLGSQSFVIIDSFLVSGFGILSQLPPIILASHYSPKGFGLEASMFSLFAASAHLGSLASAKLTIAITRALHISQHDWSNLWKLILITNLLTLAPLLFMPILLTNSQVTQPSQIHPNGESESESESESKSESKSKSRSTESNGLPNSTSSQSRVTQIDLDGLKG